MQKKSKILMGILFSILVVSLSGCGSTNTAASQPSSSNQANSAPQRQMQRNPALQAVSEIRRLQSNTEVALSSDQKGQLKPILQNLINTANPTEDFLQKQADAINALLTDSQKNFLTSSRPNRNNSGNPNNSSSPSNSNNPNGSGPQNRGNRPNGGQNNNTPNNNGNGRAFDAKTIYQQVLDSLN